MMNVGEMKRLILVKPYEFAAALAALLGVMTFGILQGVFIGVGISIIWLVAVSALPYIPELGRKPGTDAFYDLERHDDCETIPGLKILRFDGGLFFVNADALVGPPAPDPCRDAHRDRRGDPEHGGRQLHRRRRAPTS